jgi:hypothetical protein
MMASSTTESSSSGDGDSKRPKLSSNKANVLMVGTGEYTTGYVGGTAADSDKGSGVVALTMFDLRRREKVDRVGMCGVNVSKLYCVANHCAIVLALDICIAHCLGGGGDCENRRFVHSHTRRRRCDVEHRTYFDLPLISIFIYVHRRFLTHL